MNDIKRDALTDPQVAAICYAVIVQAADDYHEWQRYEDRGWRTTGRAATSKRAAVASRDIQPSSRVYITRLGEDARDWLLGKRMGGLDFLAICDALDYDAKWLGARVMQASFWRALKDRNPGVSAAARALADEARVQP